MRAPYSRSSDQVDPAVGSRKPKTRNIDFVSGDEVVYKFLFKGVVWTSHRPTGPDTLPMYGPGEVVPDGVTASSTALPKPWQRRYWFSQVRDSYVSSVRYYNGWIPWYGMRPDWVWWQKASLVGTFTCGTEYSVVDGGTIVTVVLSDDMAKKIVPNKKYRWDLESAEVETVDGAGDPLTFKGTRTWIGGRCTVVPEWTI